MCTYMIDIRFAVCASPRRSARASGCWTSKRARTAPPPPIKDEWVTKKNIVKYEVLRFSCFALLCAEVTALRFSCGGKKRGCNLQSCVTYCYTAEVLRKTLPGGVSFLGVFCACSIRWLLTTIAHADSLCHTYITVMVALSMAAVPQCHLFSRSPKN